MEEAEEVVEEVVGRQGGVEFGGKRGPSVNTTRATLRTLLGTAIDGFSEVYALKYPRFRCRQSWSSHVDARSVPESIKYQPSHQPLQTR